MTQSDRLQMTLKYGVGEMRFACHVAKTGTKTNTLFLLITLLHVSIIRSSTGSILYSLLKLQFKTLSDLLRYINLVLWQRVVCCGWVVRCLIETGCRCACCAV